MILALVIFAVTYLLMLALPKERPWVALCSAAVFMALGQLGVGYRMIDEDARSGEINE